MKLSIQGALSRAVPPMKMFWSSETGTDDVKTKNARPMLKLMPATRTVVLVPEAIPLARAGTEFITDALLGDWKRPIPAPTNERGIASCQNVTVLPICASIRKPIIDITNPDVAKNLGPYLSERWPLTGPRKASEAEMGMRNIPAVRASRPIDGPWRKNVSTRVTAPLASELRRLATAPALKSLSLKRERS